MRHRVVIGTIVLLGLALVYVAQANEEDSPCVTGGAVYEWDLGTGLVADCEALLAAKDTLRGTASLNWSASRSIGRWDGIDVGRTSRRVETIELFRQGLNGSVPAEFGRLDHLVKLRLFSNDLTGPLPSELGNLAQLEELHLRDNDLSGQIPEPLNGLNSLRVLYLRGNAFTGCIPANLLNVPSNDVSRLDLPTCSGTMPTVEPTQAPTATPSTPVPTRRPPSGATPTPLPTATPTPTASMVDEWVTFLDLVQCTEAEIERTFGEPFYLYDTYAFEWDDNGRGWWITHTVIWDTNDPAGGFVRCSLTVYNNSDAAIVDFTYDSLVGDPGYDVIWTRKIDDDDISHIAMHYDLGTFGTYAEGDSERAWMVTATAVHQSYISVGVKEFQPPDSDLSLPPDIARVNSVADAVNSRLSTLFERGVSPHSLSTKGLQRAEDAPAPALKALESFR